MIYLPGMTVSAMKDGLGMLIRSIIHGGSISRDGRLGVGDLILAINGEPTARLTNAQARAMLRRHSLIAPDMGWEAASVKEGSMTHQKRNISKMFDASFWLWLILQFAQSIPLNYGCPMIPLLCQSWSSAGAGAGST